MAFPLLRSAVRHLRATMADTSVAGVLVSYKSILTGETYADIPMVPMRHESNQESVDGFLLTDQSQDFKVRKADMPVAPNNKDLITWEGRTYQLLHTGGGRESEQSGNYFDNWRLHCKWVPDPDEEIRVYGNYLDEAYGNYLDEAYEAPNP